MTEAITAYDYIKRLEKKYRQYMENILWHIRVNKPTGIELEICNQRVKDLQEVVNDLSL